MIPGTNMSNAVRTVPHVFAAVAIAAAFLSPAQASNPGEPLDCSDWVFLEPGFTCVEVVGDCGWSIPYEWCEGGRSPVVDNDGHLLRLDRVTHPDLLSCPPSGFPLFRTRLLSLNGSVQTVLAYIDDRCLQQGGRQEVFLGPSQLSFDDKNGRLIFGFRNTCLGEPAGTCPGKFTLASIHGFTTTFEILQSYTPPSGPISFRVPYMPEGFQFADWFDTYYGTLATVGDWSQLQPLQCGYPASPPSVGDYLTVADPLPTPSPGQGYYYVTAVNYMGERRYGRRSTGGVLSGRDPAGLPGCLK